MAAQRLTSSDSLPPFLRQQRQLTAAQRVRGNRQQPRSLPVPPVLPWLPVPCCCSCQRSAPGSCLRLCRPARFASSSSPSAASQSAAAGGGGGVLSSLRSRAEGLLARERVASAESRFSAMVASMLSVPRWSLEQQRLLMEETARDAGATGWRSYVPGVSSQAGVQELRRMLAVLSAFTAAERAAPQSIDRDGRLRVAAQAQVSVADVNFILRQFSGTEAVHRWLHSRRQRGLELPTTESELQRQMETDRTHRQQQQADGSRRHKPRRR